MRLGRRGEDLSHRPEMPAVGREYQPNQDLASGTYSWQIVARTEDDRLALGPVYSFTYHRNLPPSVPREPIRLRMKEDVPAKIALAASDPEGDPLTFRIAKAPSRGARLGSGPESGVSARRRLRR